MWKQRMILKDVAAAPVSWRKMHVSGGVEEQTIIHQDAALVGTGKTAKAIEDQALPCSARPEQNRDACFGTQMYIQLEGIRVCYCR